MQQKIKDIKLKFRQAMNGIVSQNMRNLGANYKINFGLTLQQKKKIAEKIPADAQRQMLCGTIPPCVNR